MDDKLFAERLAEMRSFIERALRSGFVPVGDIPSGAVELIEDVDSEILDPYAEQLTAEALVALTEEQKTWPEKTDCDRLDAAFARLEAEGIVARQDFSCCQSCGHGEIWAEVQAAVDAGRKVRGYTFYHEQDTEAAVDGHGLHLAYGAVEEGETAVVAVATRVAETLRREGLTVTWDGSVGRRIAVALDWKRRRD